MEQSKRETFRVLGLLLALFFLWRFTYLLFVDPQLFFSYPKEELYRGMWAREILGGLDFPILSFLPDNYGGGHLVTALLTAPLFGLFGDSVFTLKLMPLFFSGGALIFFFLLLAQNFNREIAITFALFFIFCPPGYTHESLVANGDHPETSLFTALIFFLFLRVMKEKNVSHDKNLPLFWILGIISGFSLWYCYTTIVTLFVVFLCWFIMDVKFMLKKNFWAYTIGFLIGFSPWFWVQAHIGFGGLLIHGEPLSQQVGLEFLLRGLTQVKYIPGYQFMNSFAPDALGPIPSKLIRYSYAGFIVFTVSAWFLWGKKKEVWENLIHRQPSALKLIVLFTLFFVFATQCSVHQSDSIFSALHPFIYMLTAFFLEEIGSHFKMPKRTLRVSQFFIVALGIGGLFTVFSIKDFAKIFSFKGYSYYGLAIAGEYSEASLCRDYRNCLYHYDYFKKKLGEDQLHAFSYGLAMRIQHDISEEDPHHALSGLNYLIPDDFENYFHYALGAGIYDQRRNLSEAITLIKALKLAPEKEALSLSAALTRAGQMKQESLDQLLPKDIPPKLARHYWLARGNQKASEWLFSNLSAQNFYENLGEWIDPDDSLRRSLLLQGSGQALHHWWIRYPLQRHTFLREIPRSFQISMAEGMGRALAWSENLESFEIIKTKLLGAMDGEAQTAFLKGIRAEIIRFKNSP